MSDPVRWTTPNSGAPDGAAALLRGAPEPPPMDPAFAVALEQKLAQGPAHGASWPRGAVITLRVVGVCASIALALVARRVVGPARTTHRISAAPTAAAATAFLLAPAPVAIAATTARATAHPALVRDAPAAPTREVDPPLASERRASSQRSARTIAIQPVLRVPTPALAPVVPSAAPSTPSAAQEPVVEAPPAAVRERALIERARAALRAGDGPEALAAVREHEALFSRGALVEEREALAVRALSRVARVDDARARAAAYLARWPEGLYADVVRRAVAAQ